MELLCKHYERTKWQGVLGGRICYPEHSFFLHLVPPLFSLHRNIPAVLVIDGEHRLALSKRHAIAMSELIFALQELGMENMTREKISQAVFIAAGRSSRILLKPREQIGSLLMKIWKKVEAIAQGKEEAENLIDYESYMPFFRAPYRAILCLDETLSNGTWKRIMDRLVEAGVTRLVLRVDEQEGFSRKDLEDLLRFEKTVVVTKEIGTDPVNGLFDIVIAPNGCVLSQDSGEMVGKLPDTPFGEIWGDPVLVQERFESWWKWNTTKEEA